MAKTGQRGRATSDLTQHITVTPANNAHNKLSPRSAPLSSPLYDAILPPGASSDQLLAMDYTGFHHPGHSNDQLAHSYSRPARVSLCEDDQVSESPPDTPEPERKPQQQEIKVKFKDLSCKQKAVRILTLVVKFFAMLTLLYFFICSLTLLSSAFTLIGGRMAGDAFGRNPLLSNPICGLMIGVVATAFLQSSSTSTSIVITMVSANILPVRLAIPIIMGSNIGTSITGILVAVTQAGHKDQFERAFSAATVHDMFNWLTVILLLPLEIATGYLYHLTSAIVESTDLGGGGSNQQFFSAFTELFTDLIVQIDHDALNKIASGKPGTENLPLLKCCCERGTLSVTSPATAIQAQAYQPEFGLLGATAAGFMEISTVEPTAACIRPCRYLFSGTSLSEQAVGGIVLVIALVLLITCLILMVKLLKSLLQGHMASVIHKTINADFPGYAACLTGYFAILVGAIITVLVQSSSVVASALTPLVGLNLVTVERVYPMMLGANIGTTSTAILAAFAASGDRIQASFQIAMCHLFFNLSGILIWYPVPVLRRVPIRLAKFLGRTTAQYRWFATLYLIVMFFIIPLGVFAISLPGWQVLVGIGVPVITCLLIIALVNVLQSCKPTWLPRKLRTWDFLPEWMRSLAPLDRQVAKLVTHCSCCPCCKKTDTDTLSDGSSSSDYDQGQERTGNCSEAKIDMAYLKSDIETNSLENTPGLGISIISSSKSNLSIPLNYETAI